MVGHNTDIVWLRETVMVEVVDGYEWLCWPPSPPPPSVLLLLLLPLFSFSSSASPSLPQLLLQSLGFEGLEWDVSAEKHELVLYRKDHSIRLLIHCKKVQ